MEIVVIANNIRSVFNVGSIFRTAEGFGIKKIYLTGYTPNPSSGLPHIKQKMDQEINKTALGAEKLINFQYCSDINKLITKLKNQDYRIVGLEQDKKSILLPNYQPKYKKIAVLLGEEVSGINKELLKMCDDIIEIPMFGQKESFNVSVATGIVLYHLTTKQSLS